LKFEIVSEIAAADTIAAGTTLRDRRRLARLYGRGNWRKMKGRKQRFGSPMVRFAKLKSTGTKHMASAKKSSSSKGRSASGKRVSSAGSRRQVSRALASQESLALGHFAICVRNDEYPASLELRKLYPVLDDEFASQHGMLRVVDESGEDYLFPSEYFVRVNLPQAIEKKLQKIA
jgi:hypothetical protein